ncbi:unnamed protein product, partial [Brachionus calyciflorus]
DLTTKLFENNFLNNIEEITIKGIWKSIEEKLFFNIKTHTISIVIDNIPSVFIDGGSWLNSFNLTSNLSELIEVKLDIYPNKYTFPNDDFCFYVNVPNNRNFLLTAFLDDYLVQFKCTCTMILFYGTYYRLLNTSFIFKKNSFPSEEFKRLKLNGCFNTTFIESCDINVRKQKCKVYDSKNFFRQTQIIEDFQHIDFVNTILSEIISIVGLLSNFLSIIAHFPTTKNIQIKKEMSKVLYKLMLSNSIINFVYYLINVFHIMNKCVEKNGIFCPKIYYTVLAQYFDIYFVEFIGSILRLWSGLTFLALSIARLDLIGSNRLKNKEKLSKIILFIFFVLTFCLNLDKLFNIVVNRNYYFMTTDTDEEAEFPMRNTFFSNSGVNGVYGISVASNIIYSGFITLWKKLIEKIKKKRVILKKMSLDSNISKAENIEMRVTIKKVTNFNGKSASYDAEVFDQNARFAQFKTTRQKCFNVIKMKQMFVGSLINKFQ